MNDSTLLQQLKYDLQRTHALPNDDAYLSSLLEAAKASGERQGIRDDGTADYAQWLVGTAAWIYRKRITGESEPNYVMRLRKDLLLARGKGGAS